MKTKQDFNRNINQLYRQLGKEIYDDSKNQCLNRKQKKLVKYIEHQMSLVEKFEEKKSRAVESVEDAVILEPEMNEQGLMVYLFCPHCKTGNNPKSTHCIKCNKSLR